MLASYEEHCDDSDGPDIGLKTMPFEVILVYHFRRHAVESAAEGTAALFLGIELNRMREITDFNATFFVNKDSGQIQVPVQYILAVQVSQPSQDLLDYAHNLRLGELSTPLQQMRQCLVWTELFEYVQVFSILKEAFEIDEVWRLTAARGLRQFHEDVQLSFYGSLLLRFLQITLVDYFDCKGPWRRDQPLSHLECLALRVFPQEFTNLIATIFNRFAGVTAISHLKYDHAHRLLRN